MNRSLHNWISLHKHWAQPTLHLPPKLTTLKMSLFFHVSPIWPSSGTAARNRLQSRSMTLAGSVHPCWYLPGYISHLVSHHQHAGVQYMAAKWLRSPSEDSSWSGVPQMEQFIQPNPPFHLTACRAQERWAAWSSLQQHPARRGFPDTARDSHSRKLHVLHRSYARRMIHPL